MTVSGASSSTSNSTSANNSIRKPVSGKVVGKVIVVAIQVIVLLALLTFQPPLFLVGFGCGFVIKIVKKEECTNAMKKIRGIIAKHPLIFTGTFMLASIIVPQWLLVGPPLIGGCFAGMKLAGFCQKR